MSTLKKYLESIRQYSLPKTRALQHELEATREAHAAITAEHEKARENLQLAIVTDAQLLADLRQQVKQIESERSNAVERVENLQRSLVDAEQNLKSTEEQKAALEAKLEQERDNALKQVESLQHSLADAEQNRKSTEEHKAALEAKLEEERDNARKQVESLQHSLADAEQNRKSTEEHMAALKAKLEQERDNARKQVESLQHSLADAEQNRKSTEEHKAALEAKLEAERSRHEESIRATESRQLQLQAEQQSRLKQQTELANSLHDVNTRLLESLQERNKKQRYSLLLLIIIAAALFASGTLIGMLFLQPTQDSNQELALVERNIDDMRSFTKQHIDNQDALLKELALNLNKQASAEQVLLGEKLQQLEEITQATDTPQPEAVITFTPDIRELQANLMALGFDLGMSQPNGEPGIKTRQALQEFRQFYLPQSDAQDDLISEALAALILNSADRTRADAARFRIGSDVLAAIRLGSIRTGVDFSFLMELARVESYFNPAARAPKSSATGLFQFKSRDWLQAMRTFGASYGLQDYATQVALIDDEDNVQQPIMYDPLQQEALALRLNPRLSTLFAAENIKHNLQALSEMIGREPGRTDLYLSHFLGTADAAMFLKALAEEPTAIAAELFPEAAAKNPGVFQNRQNQPRTVAGVYQWFDRKFNTARYDDRNPG